MVSHTSGVAVKIQNLVLCVFSLLMKHVLLQTTIVLKRFKFLMMQCIVGLIIKSITVIKVETNKSFLQCDQSWSRLEILQLTDKTYSLFYIVLFLAVFKDNRVSRIIPRCFWDVACTILLLNTNGGCDIVLDFRLKVTSCAGVFGSGLELIFY